MTPVYLCFRIPRAQHQPARPVSDGRLQLPLLKHPECLAREVRGARRIMRILGRVQAIGQLAVGERVRVANVPELLTRQPIQSTVVGVQLRPQYCAAIIVPDEQLLQDFLAVPSSDDRPESRQWLRQVSDLLTFLVMLRSTIHTRITGDAGLDRQRVALVPVGGIGSEEMLSLMSTQLRAFLAECQVLLHDSKVRGDLVGLIVNADEAARSVFSRCKLVGTSRHQGFRSVVQPSDARRFSNLASADNAPLLPDTRAEPFALLPAHISCPGPFWLESWGDLDKEERFTIEGWLTDVNLQVGRLYGTLRRISEERSLPSKLRRPAEELWRMLGRTKEEAVREFSTVKTLDATSAWVAVPVDYARFWREGPDGQFPSLGDHEEWRDALACCLASGKEVLPVVAQYQDVPYIAVAGARDPARFSLVFDDRYLAASNELNLLNTILLASAEPTTAG